MIDRDKVIKGLEDTIQRIDNKSYIVPEDVRDLCDYAGYALALLKEDEQLMIKVNERLESIIAKLKKYEGR